MLGSDSSKDVNNDFAVDLIQAKNYEGTDDASLIAMSVMKNIDSFFTPLTVDSQFFSRLNVSLYLL